MTLSTSTVPRFAVCVAASRLQDAAALQELTGSYLVALRTLGGTVEAAGDPATDPLVVFVATGGTERDVLERVRFDPPGPALLVAHPGHNSLPAALELLARLQQDGVRGRIHYLQGPDDQDGLGRLAAAVHDLAVRRALRASRIGLVGEPSDWLVASHPAPETVRAVWGPTVVPLALESILAEPDREAIDRGDQLGIEFQAGAAARVEPQEAEVREAGRVHALLRRVVDAERLDAVAVRCFDLVVRRRTTGCLALAHLNDQGIVAGCEGDLVSTVAMVWLLHLVGSIPWMANPSRVDLERGVLSLAHCTVPRRMVGTYRLRSHFESGLGVAVQGLLPPGPVTLARIGGARMERLLAVDGELVRNTDHADLCRTQVEVAVGRDVLDELLARPLGNHMVVVPGHRAAVLRRWHGSMIA